MLCLFSISGTLATLAFKVHLADAPCKTKADIAAIVVPAIVLCVVGVGRDGMGVGGLEEVGDAEVEREVAVKQVCADAEVDVEVGFPVAEEFYLSSIEIAVDKHIHLAPQFGIHIEAYIIAKDLIFHPLAGAYLHAVPAFAAPCVKAYIHKLVWPPCEV